MRQYWGFVFLLLIPLQGLSQDKTFIYETEQEEDVHHIGLRTGAASLETYFPYTGLDFSFLYHYRLSKIISFGIRQGFIIQDNFPYNFYPVNTAPFHLPPQVDAYIRSLSFEEALDFEWTKTTLIYLIPGLGINAFRVKKFTFTIEAGFGVQYRNHSSFILKSFMIEDDRIVDYQEMIQTNSVVAPVMDLGAVLSLAVSKSIAVQLTIRYGYELGDHEKPQFYGPGSYTSLQAGLYKSF